MGKGCDLSARKRRKFEVTLKNTSMKARKIVVACKVSPQSVGRIKKKMELGEPVSPTKRCNCKGIRKTTRRHDRMLKKFVLENR
jgi:thioredoxin reductase